MTLWMLYPLKEWVLKPTPGSLHTIWNTLGAGEVCEKMLSRDPSFDWMQQKSLAGGLELSKLIFRISSLCFNSAFSGPSATATAAAAESQPAAVCVGASDHQLATRAVYHLPDAPGPAGWVIPQLQTLVHLHWFLKNIILIVYIGGVWCVISVYVYNILIKYQVFVVSGFLFSFLLPFSSYIFIPKSFIV